MPPGTPGISLFSTWLRHWKSVSTTIDEAIGLQTILCRFSSLFYSLQFPLLLYSLFTPRSNELTFCSVSQRANPLATFQVQADVASSDGYPSRFKKLRFCNDVELNEAPQYDYSAILCVLWRGSCGTSLCLCTRHLNSAHSISHPVVDFMFGHLLNLQSSPVCSVDVQMWKRG